MNLITFDEIIRLLRAKDLGLMTEDAVANQILKYREIESELLTTDQNNDIAIRVSNKKKKDDS